MKISVLPVRMISVFCTCCLSLPFFGAASAEIVSVNRADDTWESISNTTTTCFTVTTQQSITCVTTVSQQTDENTTTEASLSAESSTGSTTTRQTTASSVTQATSSSSTVVETTGSTASVTQTTGKEIVWAPIDWPLNPVPSPYDKPKSDGDSRYSHILSEIRLPNKTWIRGIKHNDECYIIPEELPVLAEIYGGGLQYDFSNLQVMEQFLNSGDKEPSILQGISLTVSSKENGGIVSKTFLWYDETTVNQPLYDLPYWTYTDRVLVSNQEGVSPLHLSMWHWAGGGLTDSFYLRYEDVVTIFEQIQAIF